MSRVATNAFWLYVAQIGGLVIPLVELPFLARALGQESFGAVLYALGLALTASVFVEFGFIFSAARTTVAVRHDRARLAQLTTDVLTAKALLGSAVVSLVAVFVLSGLGATYIPAHWIGWIAVAIFGFGFSPMWYFVGIERLILPAMLDLGLRTLGLVLVVLLVKNPAHGERVLMIQALVGAANTLIPTIMMLRMTGFGQVSLSGARRVFSQSSEIFLYKASQNILASLSSTLLGSLGGARAVGAFVPAEKLVRAASGLAGPLFNAMFPHAVSLRKDASAARSLAMSVLIAVLFCGILFAAAATVLADRAVNFVFGPGYEEAAVLLRLLVWVVPIRIASMALALLWFIPSGNEWFASRAMMVNIFGITALAIALVPSLGGLGITIAFLFSESVMLAVLLFMFVRRPESSEVRVIRKVMDGHRE